jgi:hypothetical protein
VAAGALGPGGGLALLDEMAAREAAEFREEVQGGRRGGGDDDSDEEIGPTPLPQPKEYADDRKVSRVCCDSY